LMQSKSNFSERTRAAELMPSSQAILGEFEVVTELIRQIALYLTPVAWTALFIVSLLKFNISYAPYGS
jgi:hypothetical protein